MKLIAATVTNLAIPVVLESFVSICTLQRNHKFRELSFLWNETTVVLRAKFPKQQAPCEFHVNAVQATLLNVFTRGKKVCVLHYTPWSHDIAYRKWHINVDCRNLRRSRRCKK